MSKQAFQPETDSEKSQRIKKNLDKLDRLIKSEYKQIQNSIDQHIFMSKDTPGPDNGTRRIQEKATYYYVASGDIVRVDEIISNSMENMATKPVPGADEVGDVSENPVLFAKYLLIANVTLATRAAIDGGLAEHIAYAMSDGYLRYMDKLNDIQKIYLLSSKALRDFTYAVHDYTYRNCSPITKSCCDYIMRHLHDNITMSTLSDVVGRSANYISDVFSKELGMRPTIFIREKKLEYARTLLDTTGLSISAISDLLAFPSTSSFINYFKKKYGCTPLAFKKDKLSMR
ncbi:MAG: AraC family transcriptional regulator [Butyrivibrio sp.]|nr:AraC family transcriptional regulator [Butyrivibrio sp.]